MIDQLAQGSLPPNMPAFLCNGGAHDAFGYYAPKQNRWGSAFEPELKMAQELGQQAKIPNGFWLGFTGRVNNNDPMPQHHNHGAPTASHQQYRDIH